MIEWRIYYGDRSTFDNTMGLPKKAPARNVQIIKQADPDLGWYMQQRSDCYIYRDRWIGCDILGLYDYLEELDIVIFGQTVHVIKNYGPVDILGLMSYLAVAGICKFGRTIKSKNFNEIYQTAKNDPDFGKKTRYYPGESR